MSNHDPATVVAWLAVQDLVQLWPKQPDEAASAGLFHVVWIAREAPAVRSEQFWHLSARLDCFSHRRSSVKRIVLALVK